jgi:cytochrome c biogenesis protein
MGWWRWFWRNLTSMRTALILLLVLILAAIPGSVFPQRVADPLAVNAWIDRNPGWGAFLDRLGMFDVFGTPWFAAIYLLLFISLVGCVVPRCRQLWRQWRQGPPAPPRRFGDRSHARRVELPAEVPALDLAAAHLRQDRWRVQRGDGWVSAEKGFLREVGNLAFHLSMVALLIAVAGGSLFGWRGNVIVPVGSGFANTLTQYDAWGGGQFVDSAEIPPFAFTLEEFRVEFERGPAQRGAPRAFEAEVLLQREPGAAQESRTLRVNEPLRIAGADVYLIGHGYAPTITVTGPAGRTEFSDAVVFLPQDGSFTSTGVVKLPDARPQLAFNGIFAPTAVLDENGPRSVFPAPDNPALFLSAFTGDLGLDAGEPQSVYRLDTSGLEQLGLEALTPGQSWTLPDGTTVRFDGVQRWVSLQISHDPGRTWALIAVGLVLAGLMTSLFVPRRRIWVRTSGGGVLIGAVARTENAAPAAEVDALADALTAAAPDAGGTLPAIPSRNGADA